MIQAKYFQAADGSQIYYEKSGHGRPLFLLHGNLGSGRYFSRQLPQLAEHQQIYNIDSRGHGKSSNTQPRLTFQLMAQDLYGIMEQEKVRQADLLGFSDGANLALVFAAAYPQKVRRLILNAGNNQFSGLKFFSRLSSRLLVAATALPAHFSPKSQRIHQAAQLLLTDLALDLTAITAPTLVIVGEHDAVKARHSRQLVAMIPQARLVTAAGQKHDLARRDPAYFNQTIEAFLQERS